MRHTLRTRIAVSGAALAALTVGFAAPVQAHTAFMLPNVFAANLESQVTIESSFSEDFFNPEIAVDGGDFHVILPDGSRAEFETVTRHRQVTILESAMKDEGTYRFTSGVRLGRKGKLALKDGKWLPVRGDAIPAGASTVRTSQTETVSDVYVSKKAPTRAPVDVMIGRLALHPITHPSDVYLDGPFAFEVLFDGKPLAGQTISVDRGGARYDTVKYHKDITSDAAGKAVLRFDRPGVYIVMTRHRADAPAGAGTDLRSYTTSLTFEVQP
ncbi:DUF4198 domain-containing protein [Novosphingobium beihaiensis]|uniref:DUF4198 domain-containing protein n=1 Tax=Novosphingobium beihaiensis TaxID=2930389 RepID=A0ABT0BV67_9SPHN|nr:DUF4198 domain-containing protein [Novosphingobium beihaiensis]MCJ2188828.1 DUF4198 domain-containing protein [Novosphingobium beihaiensis]